jgi:hypothetical protein
MPRGALGGAARPEDIEIRYREQGPWDVGALNCVIAVRTTLVPSRLADKEP